MTAATRHTVGPVVWTGLALGPIAWAASHQVSDFLAGWMCDPARYHWPLAVNVVGVTAALLGAALCRYGRTPEESGHIGRPGAERRFAADLGVLLNLLFAATILGQGIATLLLPPCAG